MTSRKFLPLLLLPALAACGGGHKAQAPFTQSFPGRDPRLLLDASGRLHVVYVEKRADGAAAVAYRRLGNSPLGPVRVSPQGLEIAAGKESAPTLDRLADGTLVIAYPVKLPGKWSSELRVQRSTDDGRSWEEPRLLHPSGDGAHSFLSSASSANGTVTYAWLDKTSGQMGLHAASTRDGRTFTPAETIDAETCQCCGTALAAGPKGALWLAYRDKEADDLRDFRVLRSRADPPSFREGTKLSEDGWRVQGCPETGARLAPAPDGALWAAWFTAGGVPGVYASHSQDGGTRFAPRTLLSDPARLGRHPEIGALSDGRIAILYEEHGGESSILQARIRDLQGHWGEPRTLARGGAYPRLATLAGKTAVAFTCPSEQEPSIVVADWPADGRSLPDCRPDKAAGAEPEMHHSH
ncbi:MAG: sialidase family protein [Thermoanaerobaculia bacterium]